MDVCHYVFGFTIFLFGISISQADKPGGLSQGVYCEGCIATVKELLKKVDKKTGESREIRVIEAMEDICNLQNFGSYEYSPPKTGQACNYLVENYDEEIENLMVGESEGFEEKICYELTKACEGVDRSKKEKEELEVKINDEKQTLQSGNPNKDSDPENFRVNIDEEGAAEKLVDQIKMAVKNKKVNTNEGDDEDDEGDDDDDEGDDEGDDEDNKITEHDSDDGGEDSENLTDNLKDAKTEL